MKSAFFPGFSKGFCIFFAYFKLFVLKTLEFPSVRGGKKKKLKSVTALLKTLKKQLW